MPFEKGNSEGRKFQKGQSGNPKGRRKSIYTVLKKKGFQKDDVRKAFLELLHYDKIELEELISRNKGKSVEQIEKEDSAVPSLYTTVARSLLKAEAKGEMRYIDKLVEQVIGKSHQTIETKTEVVEISASEEELKAKLAKIEADKARLEEIKAQLNDGKAKNKS